MATFLQKFVKLNVLLMLAGLATLALFYTMQLLITTEFAEPAPGSSIRIADITMPDIVIEPVRAQPKPVKPEELPPAPEIELPPSTIPQGTGTGTVFQKPDITPVQGPDSFGLVSDANAVALIQVAPVYPQRALQKEIEGYVIIEFDVDETGVVINPRVLYAEPEGYFEAAALKALERYRYKPKLVDGKEVRMYGVQQKLSFTLE